jgi:hypothetical protein
MVHIFEGISDQSKLAWLYQLIVLLELLLDVNCVVNVVLLQELSFYTFLLQITVVQVEFRNERPFFRLAVHLFFFHLALIEWFVNANRARMGVLGDPIDARWGWRPWNTRAKRCHRRGARENIRHSYRGEMGF